LGEEKKFNWQDGVSLKEYIDLRFSENQRALEKAERDLSKRLEGMNEFRDALKDQAANFVTRESMDLKLAPMEEKINSLSLSRAHTEGAASQTSVLIAYIVSAIGIILGVVSLLK